MKFKPFLPMILLAALIVYSCQAPVAKEAAIDMDQLRTELQAMEDAYAEGENTKNVDAIVAYYADDAQSLPSNEPTVVGKAAITERLKKNLASDTTGSSIKFEVVDVFASGNLAVEVGSSTTTNTDGTQTTGKYISVFEKRDGKYICVRDIWNRDKPAKNDEVED